MRRRIASTPSRIYYLCKRGKHRHGCFERAHVLSCGRALGISRICSVASRDADCSDSRLLARTGAACIALREGADSQGPEAPDPLWGVRFCVSRTWLPHGPLVTLTDFNVTQAKTLRMQGWTNSQVLTTLRFASMLAIPLRQPSAIVHEHSVDETYGVAARQESGE